MIISGKAWAELQSLATAAPGPNEIHLPAPLSAQEMAERHESTLASRGIERDPDGGVVCVYCHTRWPSYALVPYGHFASGRYNSDGEAVRVPGGCDDAVDVDVDVRQY